MKYLYPTSFHRTSVCISSLQEIYVVNINSSNVKFNSNIKSLQEGANYNVFLILNKIVRFARLMTKQAT